MVTPANALGAISNNVRELNKIKTNLIKDLKNKAIAKNKKDNLKYLIPWCFVIL